MSHPDAAPETADYISFEEFRNGLPHGRFRVIVSPALVVPFVSHLTHATVLSIALIGPGIAAALAGYPWLGGPLVLAGILVRWSVKTQASRILLHLATRVPSVYEQAGEHGVMEVRRA